MGMTSTCAICKQEANELVSVWRVCPSCSLEAIDVSKQKHVSMGRAFIMLGEEKEAERRGKYLRDINRRKRERQASEEEEVIVKNMIRDDWREPLKLGDYEYIEYNVTNIIEVEFDNERDELNYLEQIMDAALLGGDAKWASELYKQIKRVKENI